MISPSIANEALTPPIVGSVRKLIKSCPASWCLFNAAEVFAICISEIIPSCILAPPEHEKIIIGIFSSVAFSTAAVIFSPTTLPMEDIINLASHTAIAVLTLPIVASPVTTASLSLLFCLSSSSLVS